MTQQATLHRARFDLPSGTSASRDSSSLPRIMSTKMIESKKTNSRFLSSVYMRVKLSPSTRTNKSNKTSLHSEYNSSTNILPVNFPENQNDRAIADRGSLVAGRTRIKMHSLVYKVS